jgi:hypothetical protein
LISSASRKLVNTGPGRYWNWRCPSVFLQHLGADDVGRHQVGGELHPRERHVDGLAQRLQQRGLAEARHALQQRMAFGEEAHQHRADERALADDDTTDLRFDGGGEGRIPLRRDGVVRSRGGFGGGHRGSRPARASK